MKSNRAYYNFKRLIRKYTVSFFVQLPANDKQFKDDEVDDLGNPINPEYTAQKPFKGAIIPFNSREVYQSGGRITESDRQLYIDLGNSEEMREKLHLPPKTKVFHQSRVYFVEGEGNYLDFSHFVIYTLKEVSSFNGTEL